MSGLAFLQQPQPPRQFSHITVQIRFPFPDIGNKIPYFLHLPRKSVNNPESQDLLTIVYLGDNCIQNVNLGRYIVGYMVGNFILRLRWRNCRPYNRRYTSPNESFEYGYPKFNTLFNIYPSKAQNFAPNLSFVSNVKQIRQPITSDSIYDVGAPTVYRSTDANSWRYPIRRRVTFASALEQTLKYTYSILPFWNCPVSPGNGQLSKLHVNKAHFYLRVQKENAQCLWKYILFWLRCILSRRKSKYLSILFFRNGQILGLSPIRNLSKTSVRTSIKLVCASCGIVSSSFLAIRLTFQALHCGVLARQTIEILVT